MSDSEREKFEAWYYPMYGEKAYDAAMRAKCWSAWQAALADRAPAQAQRTDWDVVTAQHEETGLMWTGERAALPPRYNIIIGGHFTPSRTESAASAEDAPVAWQSRELALSPCPPPSYPGDYVPLYSQSTIDRLRAENAALLRDWHRVGSACDAANVRADALSARLAAAERVLRELIFSIDAEAKAKQSMDNAEENFSYAAPEVRAYERAMLRTIVAMKSARRALDGE